MYEPRRDSLGGFPTADATWAPSFVSPDRRSGLDVGTPLIQDVTTSRGRTSVSNVIVQNVRIRDLDHAWRSIARLRVTIERYEDGGVIAYLVTDPAFVGHGSNEQDAIADMLDELAHELRSTGMRTSSN